MAGLTEGQRTFGVVTGCLLTMAGFVAIVGSTTGSDPISNSLASEATAPASPPTSSQVEPVTSPSPTEPGFGDPIEYAGIEVTPDEPLDGFGHLCILFTIDGDVPLGFARDRVMVISGGVIVGPALDITTGRAANADVFGDPAPARREVCFPVEGWRDRDTDLVYDIGADSYRWRLAD